MSRVPVEDLRREPASRSCDAFETFGPRCAHAYRHFSALRILIALALFATLLPHAHSQTANKTGPPAVIKSFRMVQEKDGPAVEILSTKPLVPDIQIIDNPSRLVIDLPNAVLENPRKYKIDADQISTLRGDQFQASPAVARIVVDLEAPRKYTWDAAGNRLVVHLGRNPSAPNETPFRPPVVASLKPSPQPVVASVMTSGPLAIAESSLAPGAAVTASKDTAVLALSRGGEVYVCPGTSVSVTPSQNGHNVLLGMNRGALETHFTLDASSDSILTPDFRILLPGPGEFHYAVSADSRGNTCVRALPGNTSSAIVSELMGDRTYQVKATDQLVFRLGQLDQVDRSVPIECGCPPPPQQSTMQAVNEMPSAGGTPAAATPAPAGESSVAAVEENREARSQRAPGERNSTAPTNETRVQVSAPLVFHAPDAPPAPVDDVRSLPPDSRSLPPLAMTAPQPPAVKSATTKPANQRSFFRRLGGFFAAIFR
jgi:hypothetical protein